MKTEINGKKYRINVGIAVINLENKFFVGRRTNGIGENEFLWQMPQGGQDEGETIEETAIRELYEETGIKSIKILKITDWMTYDYPPEIRAIKNNDGQVQKWVLALFTGDDSEINLNIDKEFSEYKWEDYKTIIENTIPFRKEVYTKLFDEFKEFIS